jgi:hypothetical protein
LSRSITAARIALTHSLSINKELHERWGRVNADRVKRAG